MSSSSTTSRQQASQARQRFRNAVADMVGALRSQEINKGFVSFTLEEAIDQQIERIEGDPTATRVNQLTRVDRIKTELDAVIEAIKNTDPDLFRAPSSNDDANTAPDGGS